jgi:hypothetical protein
MVPSSRRRRGPSVHADALPLFCDFTCPHAAFATPEATGACRREQAVYCGLADTYNTKHRPCLAMNPPMRKGKR